MKIRDRYNINKKAKVGEQCICPSCNSEFKKANYQQAFCKTKSGTICKDKYWNTVTPEKRNNTTRISPASASWMEMKEAQKSTRVKRTSEGYRIINGIAYNEFDAPVYKVDPYEDDCDHGQWND